MIPNLTIQALAHILRKHPNELYRFQYTLKNSTDSFIIKSYIWGSCFKEFKLERDENLRVLVSEMINRLKMQDIFDLKEFIDEIEDKKGEEEI